MKLWWSALFLLLAGPLAGCPQTPEGLPTANFTFTPDHGVKNLAVQFTDTSDPGDAAITAWAWNFGDDSTSTEQHPLHTYTKNGVYDVKLTVTNSIGSNATLKTEVVIVGNVWAAADGYEGNDGVAAVSATAGTDVLILSTITPTGRTDTDFQLQRRNANGEIIWTKFYGGTANDVATSMVFDDGEITLCGTTVTTGRGVDIYVIHADATGEILWEDTYGTVQNDSANRIIVSGGNFVIAGATGSNIPDAYLLKLDSEGEVLWSKTYGGTTSKEVLRCVRAIDDGFILCGEQGSADFYAIRTDAAGAQKWAAVFDGTGTNRAYEIFQQGTDFVLIGSGYSAKASGYDVMVLKADKDGKELSRAFAGGLGLEQVYGAIGSGGAFTVVGSTTSSPAEGADLYLLNIKADGTKNWSRILGGAGDETGAAVAFVSGELLIGGTTTTWTLGGTDNYLLRTTLTGNGPEEPDPAL